MLEAVLVLAAAVADRRGYFPNPREIPWPRRYPWRAHAPIHGRARRRRGGSLSPALVAARRPPRRTRARRRPSAGACRGRCGAEAATGCRCASRFHWSSKCHAGAEDAARCRGWTRRRPRASSEGVAWTGKGRMRPEVALSRLLFHVRMPIGEAALAPAGGEHSAEGRRAVMRTIIVGSRATCSASSSSR